MKNNNISFQLFHLEGNDQERNDLYRKSLNFFEGRYKNLNSTTIRMSNVEDYNKFVSENPDFLVSPIGYEYPTGKRGWKFGELGLWASTFLALKKFLQTDDRYLLVAEDDIEVAATFQEHLQECLDYLNEDFDVFMFFNPNNRNGAEGTFGPKDIGTPDQTWSTLCYVITREGAQKTLDYIAQHSISKPIDWHYLQLKDVYKTVSITKQSKRSCWIGVDRSTIQNAERQFIQNSKPSVLFVVHRYAPYPGGSENYVRDMAEEALGRGYNVHVLSETHMGNFNGVMVTSDKNILYGNWDLVVVHGAERYQYSILKNIKSYGSNRVLFLPIELQHHGIEKLKQIFRSVDYIGYSTNEELKILQQSSFMPKVRYVRHGIHKARSSGTAGFKEKYGIKNRMFLSSGGFWTHKGMQNLVDIFEEANIPDATLVLTGYYMGTNSETLTFDSEKVRALLLPDRQEVLSAMLEADLYILNSYKEGFGLVLLESMLNGLPWASRNTPGALDMADFGFVYEKDVDLLEYLKTYKKPDSTVGISEVVNNRLIKNTLDDILSVAKQ